MTYTITLDNDQHTVFTITAENIEIGDDWVTLTNDDDEVLAAIPCHRVLCITGKEPE